MLAKVVIGVKVYFALVIIMQLLNKLTFELNSAN